jgi:hypothetical protein
LVAPGWAADNTIASICFVLARHDMMLNSAHHATRTAATAPTAAAVAAVAIYFDM